VEGKDTK